MPLPVRRQESRQVPPPPEAACRDRTVDVRAGAPCAPRSAAGTRHPRPIAGRAMRKFRVRKPDRPHRPALTGIAKQHAQERLLELIANGITTTRAAQEVDVSTRTVMTWAAENED